MVRTPLLALLLVAVALSSWGCQSSTDSHLIVTVNYSALSAEDKARIDTIQLYFGGTLRLPEHNIPREEWVLEEATFETAPAQGAVLIRAVAVDSSGADAGEVSAVTRQFTLTANGKDQELTLTLVPQDSPNGCQVRGFETALFDGRAADSFDLIHSPSAGVSLIAFADPATGAGDLRIGRIDSDGGLQGALLDVGMDASHSAAQPKFAVTDTGFAVIWNDYSETSGPVLKVRRLQADGTPLAETGSRALDPATDDARPSIVSVDGTLFIGWQEFAGSSLGAWVAPLGADLAPVMNQAVRLSPTDADGGFVTLARTPNGFAATWSDTRTGDWGVRAANFSSTGTLVHESALREAAGSALLGRAVWDWTAQNLIAAWEDIATGNEQELIWGATYSEAGVVTGAARDWSEPGFAKSSNWPNLAFAGDANTEGHETALVYYQFRGLNDGPQVYLSRLSGSGQRQGEGDLQVSQNFGTARGARYPAVTWQGPSQSGNLYGVVWRDERGEAPALYYRSVYCGGI